MVSAFRKVPPQARTWAPAGRKSAWEHLLHAAYWKHRLLLKLGADRKFERKGSNWPKPPASPDRAAWQADLALLKAVHEELVARVNGLGAIDTRTTFLVIGVAQHDVYHNGQVRLLTRLWKDQHDG